MKIGSCRWCEVRQYGNWRVRPSSTYLAQGHFYSASLLVPTDNICRKNQIRKSEIYHSILPLGDQCLHRRRRVNRNLRQIHNEVNCSIPKDSFTSLSDSCASDAARLCRCPCRNLDEPYFDVYPLPGDSRQREQPDFVFFLAPSFNPLEE